MILFFHRHSETGRNVWWDHRAAGKRLCKIFGAVLREHLREREQAGLRSLGIFKSSKKSPVFFFLVKDLSQISKCITIWQIPKMIRKKSKVGDHELYKTCYRKDH